MMEETRKYMSSCSQEYMRAYPKSGEGWSKVMPFIELSNLPESSNDYNTI